ncbi:MAG: TIGR04086 family membrane protein [Bacilli bacterium]
MKLVKNYVIPLLFVLGIIIIFTFILTLFSYFDIINSFVVSIIELIIVISSIFIGGFIIGKKSYKKGWIQGLKLGLIYSFTIFLINLIFFHYGIHFKNIPYFIILLVSCIVGSITGINYSEKNKKI